MALLREGHVVEGMQFHDLTVSLVLDDGCSVITTEPAIDAIIHEARRLKCANPRGCRGIVMGTE